MTNGEQIVQRFYECLTRNDATGMAECYCDDATFHDMAFDLRGRENIAAMWRFECSRGLVVTFRDVRTEGQEVKGHWACDYKFQGKNEVHNEIDSTFTLREGKILTHRDDADRWTWAKQALGFPKSMAVMVAPILLRWEAEKELKAFREKERSGRSN